MASVDRCIFNATTGGLGDFAVGSPVIGYLTPAQANAQVGAPYHYVAQTTDGAGIITSWEVGTGAYTAGVLARTTIEFSSNSNSKVNFSSAPKVMITALAQDWREILTGNRTYYVSTTGSDSNDGLTAGTPFLTMQKAANVVQYGLDFAGYTVTIQVADGTYSEGAVFFGPIPGGSIGGVVIQGNMVTPANVVFTGPTSPFNDVFIFANGGIVVTVQGFKISNASPNGDGFHVSQSGILYIGNVVFGSVAANQIDVDFGGILFFTDNYSITGGAATHMASTFGGLISAAGVTATITGTPAFTRFVYADQGGVINSGLTFSGSATGNRFLVNEGGLILTGGSGLSYFPGNADGTLAIGGQYDDLIGGQREFLTGNRTYYVRADGSDSNTGLVNSAGGAFLTIQHAFNVIIQTLDLGDKTVTISIGSGTFAGTNSISSWVGGGDIVLNGNGAANTIVDSTGDVFDIQTDSYGGTITFQNMKITSTGNFGIRVLGNCTLFSGTGMEYGSVTGGAHISIESPGAIFNLDQSYTISGSAPFHITTQFNAPIQATRAITVTLTGSPTFPNGFVRATTGAVYFAAAPTTYVGSTGSNSIRYLVELNGVINTQGGGANYFPGDTPGSSATGGQYV